jgi:hypothetical protein
VLQLPEPSKAQVPETAQACRVGTKRTAAKNSNGASERCTRLLRSRDERERIVFTGVVCVGVFLSGRWIPVKTILR